MTAADYLKALGPKKAIVDGDLVESHKITDLIAWDKYQRKIGSGNPFRKLKFCKFASPPAVCGVKPPECGNCQ